MNINHAINDPLAVIYNEGNWRISRVSPMHNLQYTNIKLKQYATKIRQAFVSTVAMTSSLKFHVLVENMPLLKYSEEDPDGLMVTVSSTQESNNTNKVIYVAILLSWGISISINNVIHLPYMLEHGEQRVGNTVKCTLQKLFDCIIKQYTFTQHQLLHFGFTLIENDTSRTTDPFILNYRTPQINFKDKLSLTFEIGDIHAIWNKIKDEVSTESEMIYVAFQVIHNQICQIVTLDIVEIDLCEVILPKAEVKCNGVVKMRTPELVNAVFTVLNHLSDSFLSYELDIANNI